MPKFNYQEAENLLITFRGDTEMMTEEKIKSNTLRIIQEQHPGKSFTWHITRADKFEDEEFTEVLTTFTLTGE